MRTSFPSYQEAFTAARERATKLQMNVGLYHQNEFGRKVFNIMLLPKPTFRTGRELTCQVVSPEEPAVT